MRFIAEMSCVEEMHRILTGTMPVPEVSLVPVYTAGASIRFPEPWRGNSGPYAIHKAVDGLRRIRGVCLSVEDWRILASFQTRMSRAGSSSALVPRFIWRDFVACPPVAGACPIPLGPLLETPWALSFFGFAYGAEPGVPPPSPTFTGCERAEWIEALFAAYASELFPYGGRTMSPPAFLVSVVTLSFL